MCFVRNNPAEDIINGNEFDRLAADRLAHREHYPDAARRLQHVTGLGAALIPALQAALDSPPFQIYRTAIAVGAINRERDIHDHVTLDTLRALDTSAARWALIALGEPLDWKAASRPERALFVLCHIIRTSRRGES